MQMKHFLNSNRLWIIFFMLFTPLLFSWGIFGHEHINRAAVLALPTPLLSFFYNHIDFITKESSVPDLRKYTLNDKTETPRHFINLENFGASDSVPALLAEAKKKYDEKFLQQNGILPWYIQEIMDKLTQAFKEKRGTEILFLAADLGHYIGDAHMPLHIAINHDGQFTNQRGIHAFWESQMPEIFGEKYNYYVGEAQYIEDLPKEIWRIINTSHLLADTLLLADKELKRQFQSDKFFLKDTLGNTIMNKFNSPVHSIEYSLNTIRN